MHYQPLHLFDQFESQFDQFFSANLINYSQRPSVYIDPCGSSGATLVLPYVHPSSNLVIPAGEWQTMGQVKISSFTPLKHANGATDRVELSIFIWAEDVHLSMPTSANAFGMVPQSGIIEAWKNDEYKGMVSGPAAIVEHVAGRLRNAPVIGPYAMATQTVASTVGSIARFFGFSRPSMPEQAMFTTEIPCGNTTNTNVHDQSIRLALDAKQETTIDSRVNGLDGSDEMSIKSIITRESYLTRFTWTTAASNETLLWTSYVTPSQFARSTANVAGTSAPFHMTALAFGTLPFHYWRGTLIFRFMIVASPYHKGKLVVKFDPRQFFSSEYNTNLTHMIDIEEDKDFEVAVGWSQGLNYLRVPYLTAASQPFYQTTRLPLDVNHNGVIEVSVHNGLTSPNSVANNDVQVLVFVRAGDDFEVTTPDDNTMSQVTYFPQSGEINLNADAQQEDPEKAHVRFTVGNTAAVPLMNAIHFGDPVTSFLQCLKRYQLSTVISSSINDFAVWDLLTSDFPLLRGRAPEALDEVTSGTPPTTYAWNYTNTTLLTYLTPAYQCRRGGLRRMYFLPGPDNPSFTGLTAVTREVRSARQSFFTAPLPASSTDPVLLKRRVLALFPSMWKGAHLTTTVRNNVVNVELPYQNNRRFIPGKRANFTEPSVGLTSHRLTAHIRTTDASRAYIADYVSVAEDFNLSFYTGPPKMWLAPSPGP